jgi:hypothetical protein
MWKAIKKTIECEHKKYIADILNIGDDITEEQQARTSITKKFWRYIKSKKQESSGQSSGLPDVLALLCCLCLARIDLLILLFIQCMFHLLVQFFCGLFCVNSNQSLLAKTCQLYLKWEQARHRTSQISRYRKRE